jgi:hypothetical protein
MDPVVERNPHHEQAAGDGPPLKKKRKPPAWFETGGASGASCAAASSPKFAGPPSSSCWSPKKADVNRRAAAPEATRRLATALAKYADTDLQDYVDRLNASEVSPPATQRLVLVKRNGPDDFNYYDECFWGSSRAQLGLEDESDSDEGGDYIDVGGGIAFVGSGAGCVYNLCDEGEENVEVVRDTDTHAEAVGKLMRNGRFDLLGDGWIREGRRRRDPATIMRPHDLMHS